MNLMDLNFMHHLAELSGLSFSEKEFEKFAKQMEEMVTVVDKVKEFEDLSEKHERIAENYKNLREDEVKEVYKREKMLENAKVKNNHGIIVPNVIR